MLTDEPDINEINDRKRLEPMKYASVSTLIDHSRSHGDDLIRLNGSIESNRGYKSQISISIVRPIWKYVGKNNSFFWTSYQNLPFAVTWQAGYWEGYSPITREELDVFEKEKLNGRT